MHSVKLILKDFRYFSPVWVFASLNILIGSWVLYIPNVKEKLHLDDGQLGVALFCYALGILVMIPFIASINQRFGIGRYTFLGVILFSVSFLFPLLAPNFLWLCISLFIVGVFSGSTDISMNALVSEIEKKNVVSFMSAAHGFFSLGGVIGAGIGSFFLLGYISPLHHMFLVSVIIIITNLFLAPHYYHIREEQVLKEITRYKIAKYKPLALIALIAVAIMGSEGAIENWSKLYMLEVVQINSERVAGYGFVIFSATMTLGRFFGDGISQKHGSNKIIIGGSFIAVFAYLCILSANLYVSIIGFGILGLGLSVIIPELFRIAGQTKGVSSSAGIAFVSGIGFAGFLAGPVALGFISKLAGLKSSFIVLLVITIIACLLAVLRKKQNKLNKKGPY